MGCSATLANGGAGGHAGICTPSTSAALPSQKGGAAGRTLSVHSAHTHSAHCCCKTCPAQHSTATPKQPPRHATTRRHAAALPGTWRACGLSVGAACCAGSTACIVSHSSLAAACRGKKAELGKESALGGASSSSSSSWHANPRGSRPCSLVCPRRPQPPGVVHDGAHSAMQPPQPSSHVEPTDCLSVCWRPSQRVPESSLQRAAEPATTTERRRPRPQPSLPRHCQPRLF